MYSNERIQNSSEAAGGKYAFNANVGDKSDTESVYAFEKIDGCRCDQCTDRVHKTSNSKLDEVESVYAFDGTTDSDEKDEVASVYAFDYSITATATMERSSIEVEKVALQVNESEPTETEDVNSVYAFEGMNSSDVPSNTDGDGIEAEVLDQVEEVASTFKTEVRTTEDTHELFILGCLTDTFAFFALIFWLCGCGKVACIFVGPAILFSCCFAFNYLDDLYMQALQRRLDRQWAKSARLVTAGAETDATKSDKADEDVASVYAYDAIKVDEAPSSDFSTDVSDLAETTGEAEIDTTIDNYENVSVYAYDAVDDGEYEINTTDTESGIIDSAEDDSEAAEFDDDAASVHTYDDIDVHDVSDSSVLTSDEDEVDTTESQEVIDASESVETTEGNSPFGFNILNLGLKVDFHYQNNDYGLYITKNSTIFETKETDETLYLFFEGQHLDFVLYRGEEYHSFAALPSKVADLLVIVRLIIVALSH